MQPPLDTAADVDVAQRADELDVLADDRSDADDVSDADDLADDEDVLLPTGAESMPFRLSTLDAIESDIVGVAAAIEALDNGTYGRCGFCGTEIDAARLVADPLAVRCAAHR